MEWYPGEVSSAIQKAIGEKKVFIVFVKDDSENSVAMETLWNDTEVTSNCTEDKSVAINITSASVPGQQFGAIYPILVVPSTYVINNQGIPTDIIPGLVEKEEFVKRLGDAIEKTLEMFAAPTETQEVPAETLASAAEFDGANASSAECLNDDLDAELTPQEKSQIEMLREKVKLKREEEEKQRLKEIERKRRETGAELQIAQRDVAERQAMKLAKEIADRKSDDKIAREKVREQIRRDQAEKKARYEKEKQERQESSKKKSEAAAVEVEKKKAAVSNTARILFRLPDGSSVSNNFNSDATFFLAETFIKEHLNWSRVRLTTVYPKHEFNSDDMLKTFRDLGLVPNASIIVSTARPEASSTSVSSSNPASLIWLIFSPIFAILSWIASLFSASSSGDAAQSQQTPEPSTAYNSQSNNTEDSVRRRNVPKDPRSNIQRLRRDDDDDNATWNGNSTQQM